MINRLFYRAVAAVRSFFVPDVEAVVGGLNRVRASLDRAVDRAEAAAEAERSLQQASIERTSAVVRAESAVRMGSYEREDAAVAAMERAKRVRGRIDALLA